MATSNDQLDLQSMNCKNCDEIFEGNFCSNCGQSSKVEKINVPNFLSEISSSIFQINKGLFFTVRELFLHPGQSIHDYLNGRRKPYFKPIAYAFALSTLYLLVSKIFNIATFIDDFTTGWANEAPIENIKDRQLVILEWFGSNYAYSILLLLPIFSLASHIAFHKFKLNYLEHVVLNAFITGQQAMIHVVFAIFAALMGLFGIEKGYFVFFSNILAIFYTTMVFWQFFGQAKRVGILLRTALTYLLYLTIAMVFTLLFLFILLIT